jgi:hypothetical protein
MWRRPCRGHRRCRGSSRLVMRLLYLVWTCRGRCLPPIMLASSTSSTGSSSLPFIRRGYAFGEGDRDLFHSLSPPIRPRILTPDDRRDDVGARVQEFQVLRLVVAPQRLASVE